VTPHEKAYWLADKIPAYGDYAKEAALILMRQADEIERLRSQGGTAKERFDECLGGQEPDPLERLRFFCSLAMTGQDWLDVEVFFDALKTPNVEVTGAARLYRAASSD
jgi:hypothetical protein